MAEQVMYRLVVLVPESELGHFGMPEGEGWDDIFGKLFSFRDGYYRPNKSLEGGREVCTELVFLTKEPEKLAGKVLDLAHGKATFYAHPVTVFSLTS